MFSRTNKIAIPTTLLITDISGKTPEIISDNQYTSYINPILSQDGSYVAFYTGTNQKGEKILILSRTDGTSARAATTSFYENTVPAFSPDGSMLAFYEDSANTGTFRLRIVKTADPDIEVLKIELPGSLNKWKREAMIDWSDDNLLTFISTDTDGKDIINIYSYSGERKLNCKIAQDSAYMPVLSPDKRYVAFAQNDGNLSVIEVANPVNIKKLTDVGNSAYCIYPQWSPDGNSIMFSKYYLDDVSPLHSLLEILDFANFINNSTRNITILYNNAYRGFWYRK